MMIGPIVIITRSMFYHDYDQLIEFYKVATQS